MLILQNLEAIQKRTKLEQKLLIIIIISTKNSFNNFDLRILNTYTVILITYFVTSWCIVLVTRRPFASFGKLRSSLSARSYQSVLNESGKPRGKPRTTLPLWEDFYNNVTDSPPVQTKLDLLLFFLSQIYDSSRFTQETNQTFIILQ